MIDTLIVCALEQETNNQLNDYNVLHTGVGKVNSTFELTRYFMIYGFPKLVINYGTAGSRDLPIGELVECGRFVQRDMDVSPLGFPRGTAPFDKTASVLGEAHFIDSLVVGSGDSFVINKKEYEGIDVFDMEAFCIAKICDKWNIPFKCYKYITDNADEKSPNDWEQNVSDGILKFKEILDKTINKKNKDEQI